LYGKHFFSPFCYQNGARLKEAGYLLVIWYFKHEAVGSPPACGLSELKPSLSHIDCLNAEEIMLFGSSTIN
jgi:hypothetical protein